jgi:hypothetical protein
MARMGRPKKDEGTMDFRITVVVNRVQAELIKGVAAAKGQSASAWARDVLLKSLPKEIE